MSDAQRPIEIDARDTQGCLDSWVVRIVGGVILIGLLVTLIGFVAYSDTRNDRSQPIDIEHYPGIEMVSERVISNGISVEEHVGYYENMSSTLLTDIEAYYQRQLDTCFRLSEDLSDPAAFHTIICEIDRSHDWLGFTQVARLEIRPERDNSGDWTGELVVKVDQVWEG
jgi:hypothetical protein